MRWVLVVQRPESEHRPPHVRVHATREEGGLDDRWPRAAVPLTTPASVPDPSRDASDPPMEPEAPA